jgi:lipopolysaccharide/colanic/teichoic acid biosynthesis glycosyltransferase
MRAIYGRVAAACLMVLGMPIHLLLSVCVRLFDGGPALYRARRLGRHGCTYGLLKYRSMKVGSKPIIAGDFKVVTVANDRRITPIGRILRCGIDELPQVYNVLRGEMAWIGPRPDEPWMLDHYGPAVRTRLAVRPGITGLAQVCDGRYLSTAQSYALDIWYIRHGSLWLRLWIILVTPLFIAGLRSVGARRFERIRHSQEYKELQHACTQELEKARFQTATAASAVEPMKALS